MLFHFFIGKKNRLTAWLLAMALCLPLLTVALAASAPSAPDGLTAVAGNGQVGLIWFAPENDGGAAIIGYQVSIDGGATWTDVGLATSYTYTGLASDKTYVFMVRAVNSAGSGDEAIASAKPKDGGSSTGQGNQQGQGQGAGGGGGGGGGQQVEPPKPPDTPVKPPDKPPVEPQDKPADEPPPQVEPPQPEDYIPVEIDPADVAQKPFRPKRAQIKKQAGTYRVVASGMRTCYGENTFKWDVTLDFTAVNASDSMYGNYTGNGSLSFVMDQAYYLATTYSGAVIGEWAEAGPLTNIQFGLYVPVGAGPLAPLPPIQPATNSGGGLQPLPPLQPAKNSGDGLQPLPPLQPASNDSGGLTPLPPVQPATNSGGGLQPLPPLKPMPVQAEGKGTMFWNPSDIQNYFYSPKGGAGQAPPFPSMSLPIEIIIYTNGNGILKMQVGVWSLTFKAQLVKNAKLTPQPAPSSTNSSTPLPPLQPAAGSGNPLAPLPPLQPAAGH